MLECIFLFCKLLVRYESIMKMFIKYDSLKRTKLQKICLKQQPKNIHFLPLFSRFHFNTMQLNNDSQLYFSQAPSRNEQQKYRKIKVLGEGSMGKVYLVECPLQNNKNYVMKRINIGHLEAKQKEQALLEAQLHNMVKHQNIIEFKEIYHTTKDKLCIIMEYADGGDLDQLLNNLKQSKKFLTEDQILSYFTQICLALREIHEKKIVHRDLKGANIFLAQDNKIKVGDFGISKAMDRTVLASKSFVGTPFYLSPEMVEGKPYSTKADIWALGVILYHMTALRLPFDANSLPVLALKILKGSYPQISGNMYSKELRNLISSMLQVDQKKRPSVNQILCKPILSKYLPKEFVAMITPKIQAKVQLKVERIKLATTKSKKQLKAETQKLTEQQKKKKREEDKLKREEERKKMRDDIKNKRMQSGQNPKQNEANLQLSRPLQIIPQSAQIPKKKSIPKTLSKPVVSAKNIKQTPKQQLPKSPPKQIEKPWKNKNLVKEKKQPQIQIRLPGQKRKSTNQIHSQPPKPQPKVKDIPVQILVKGQNPYRSIQAPFPERIQSPLNQRENLSDLQRSNLISQNTSHYIEELMENNSYKDTNLKDLLANVQKAQLVVSNLHNPYEKNSIQLYEESDDFDNTMNWPHSGKQKKFEQNQSDAENLKYITNITDTQNLEQLRQILEDRLGEEGFIKAHNVIRQHFDQLNQNKISEDPDTEESEAYMFNRKVLREKLNFMSQDQFDRNIQLLYTISVMEDLQMMKNFDTSEEEEQIYEDDDDYKQN